MAVTMSSWDEFNAWLRKGIDQGWCSEPVCERHDGLPWTEEEVIDHQAGEEFCVPCTRLYGMETVQ